MVFPVVINGCESWTIKKAEHQRIGAFDAAKTLESPLNSKEMKLINTKGNQPWIFIGVNDAEALIFWPPDVKRWLIGKDPGAGKDWGQEERGDRRQDGWMASPTQWTWVWAHSVRQHAREAWHAAVHGVTKSQKQLSDWITRAFNTCTTMTGFLPRLLHIWK